MLHSPVFYAWLAWIAVIVITGALGQKKKHTPGRPSPQRRTQRQRPTEDHRQRPTNHRQRPTNHHQRPTEDHRQQLIDAGIIRPAGDVSDSGLSA